MNSSITEEVQSTNMIKAETESNFVTCIGYMDNVYYYTSNTQKQIIGLTPNAHNKANFFSLASLGFWMKKYGKESNGKIKICWDEVTSSLMAECKSAGLCDPENVRGIGVWRDGENYVINNGEKIHPNLKNTKYFYEKHLFQNLSFENPLNDDESLKLLSVFSNLPFKNKRDYIFVSAWLIQAQIYSILEWRFHLWITGNKGSGKTTVMEWMGKLILNPLLTSNATAAGIVQELKNNARAVIFDESEANSNNVESIIELARRMSSNNGNKTLRGTSSGKALSYNTNTIFLMASIQVVKLNSADRSRFFIINSDERNKQCEEIFDKMKCDINFYESKKERIFARAYQAIDSIKKSTNLIRSLLLKENLESRFADQISVSLACYWVFHSIAPIGYEEAKGLIHELELKKSDYAENNEFTDQEDCLDALMQLVLANEQMTVLQVIEALNDKIENNLLAKYENILGVYGLKYLKNDHSLFIGANAYNLIKEMKNCGFPSFIDILKRDEKRILNSRIQLRVKGFGNKKGIIVSLAGY